MVSPTEAATSASMPLIAPTMEVSITPNVQSPEKTASKKESRESANPASAKGFILECITLPPR